MSLSNCPACGSPYRDWQRVLAKSKPSEAHKFCVNPWHFQDGPPKLPVDSRDFKFKEATGMQHPNFEEPDYSAFARDEQWYPGKRSGRPVRMPAGGTGRSFPERDMAYARITYDVLDELKRAEAKFPDQSLPWGGDPQRMWGMVGQLQDIANVQRAVVNSQLKDGRATWFDVVAEELLEAGAESGRSKNPDDSDLDAFLRLKAELTQVAAMSIRAIADLENRRAKHQKEAGIAAFRDKLLDPLPRGRTAPGDLGYSKPHPLDRPAPVETAEVPDGRGKHAGACRCKGCEEPDPGETNAYATGLNFPADDERDDDVPPNAGSAS